MGFLRLIAATVFALLAASTSGDSTIQLRVPSTLLPVSLAVTPNSFAPARRTPTYTTPLCGDDFAMGNEQSYTYKDANHPICMVINNQTKAVFYPGVDIFTLLEINNCS